MREFCKIHFLKIHFCKKTEAPSRNENMTQCLTSFYKKKYNKKASVCKITKRSKFVFVCTQTLVLTLYK